MLEKQDIESYLITNKPYVSAVYKKVNYKIQNRFPAHKLLGCTIKTTWRFQHPKLDLLFLEARENTAKIPFPFIILWFHFERKNKLYIYKWVQERGAWWHLRILVLLVWKWQKYFLTFLTKSIICITFFSFQNTMWWA